MKLRIPHHSTVVAYVALLLALGGSAYAALRISSDDIVNDSIRSKDLADRKAVSGKDVRQNALSGDHIREARLDAEQFTAFAQGGGSCTPVSTALRPCGDAAIRLPAPSRALFIVSGGFTGPAGSRASCTVRVGDADLTGVLVGGSDNDVFSVNGVTPSLSTGEHRLRLDCLALGGSPEIQSVTISAFGIGEFR